MIELDEATKEIMAAIAEGADIYGYSDAGLLRKLERDYPEMIDIGKARMYEGDGADQMPYFGAILTDAGRAAIEINEGVSK